MYYDPAVCKWALDAFEVMCYVLKGWFPLAHSKHLDACEAHAACVLKASKT